MDKIQAAIAKARATRNTTAPTRPKGSVEPPAPVEDHAVSPEAAWQALAPLSLDSARMERNRIVALQGGRMTSATDMMRTRILQQMRANNWRRLAITSPTAGCGKTTISLNLAFSLSRQPDLRTLLLDLDLRRPAIAKTLGVTQDIDFVRVMDGSGQFADNALRHGDTLAISSTQHPQSHPAELLGRASVADTLHEIEVAYDPTLMIFDMPPMLVSDDMMAFAGQVDCVLMLAAAEMTTIKEIDLCERELSSQTNVLGVVLNKCRHIGADYGYYA
ncbi:chromosome partitioning protein [Jannaschia sp. AI_61]|uniref:nucleotide-binding protein n=1 Tax=Jannaschia sp. AI_61 TaxID=2829796 RepID=UPI001BC03214|nr:P-loop NTPase [Jannaschia sp. AI_61]GIT93295.1 chromosome partitioning protein [Jannaschia sp. AI_61]